LYITDLKLLSYLWSEVSSPNNSQIVSSIAV
jgi:hypothetical protein